LSIADFRLISKRLREPNPMNAALHRILKSTYRKEPISSFVMTMGAVDAAIGGLGSSWSLFSLGLGMVGIAIALRWLQIQRKRTPDIEAAPEYYLPPASSQPMLPKLQSTRSYSPHRHR
jgi:hypothetical protein